MGMDPAYPAVPATHLCDDRGIRPVQVGKASEWVWVGHGCRAALTGVCSSPDAPLE